MKKQVVSKFNTIFVLIGMFLNMLPMQVFAETTNTVGIKISEATLLTKEGLEISQENRLAADTDMLVRIHWEQSEEGAIEDGTIVSYQLPENLTFLNATGDLEAGQGSYQVEENHLRLTFTKNYASQEEDKMPESETMKFYEGDLELAAKTKHSEAEEEVIQFEEHISPTLYYEIDRSETEETTNVEVTQEKTKETKKTTRALVNNFDVTGLKLEKASSTAPGGWVEIQPGDKTKVGDFIRLKIDWEILNSLSIANGDYAEIDLPSIFKFAPTSKMTLTIVADGKSYNIGTYQLITVGDHSKIRVEFNDTIAQNNISSVKDGHFTFQGSLNETKSEQEKVDIGSITLPNFEIGDPVLNEVGPGNYQDLSKEGTQRQNENALSWRIVTNYTDLMRAYKGDALQNRYENAVMVDELAEGLEFTSLSIQIPVLMADASDPSKLYTRQIDSLTVKTTQVPSKSTYQESYDFIKTCPAGTFTVFTESSGKQKVIMNMGTFPVTKAGDKSNSLSLSQSKADAIQKISNAYDSNTTLPSANKENTLKALEKLFDASQDTGIVGFLVNIVTKVDDDHLGQATFDNKASIDFDGDRNIDAEATNVHFQDITGGGTGTIPKGTVEVIKKDQETKDNLSGIVFSVVKYDGDVEGAEVTQLTTDAQGKVKFENLAIGKYKIKEISGLENYNPKMIIENQTGLTTDGVFEIKATDKAGFQFTILNKKMSVKQHLEATKTLTGRDLQAGEFEFELLDDQGKVLDTKSNDASGKVIFDERIFDKEGTYTYKIREKAGNESTITYDKTEYTATVTVKNTNGKLEATVSYSGTVNFANTYTPAAGSAVLEATKTLTGRDLQANEFEFELLDDQGKVVDTKSNDASGKIYFKAIDYAKEGTYEYVIREKAGNDSTIGYDKTEYKATVTVKDIGGKLEATVVYSGTVNFANTYTPAAGSAVLEATKTLTGRDLQAGEFEFELLDDKGKVVDTKSNDASGNIYFKAIDYDKEGTYEYVIREKAGSNSTIGYDKTEYQATVTVKDIGGKLEATVVYSGTVNFANTYRPAAGSAVLEATKTLTGRDLQAGEFEFELLDDKGKVMDTKSNDASGNIYFKAIDYAKEGTYEYTIREKAGNDTTIGYDKTEYKATVTVKDIGGKLEATVVYSGTVNFANTYTPAAGSAVLEATKTLTGRDLQAGEFEFELVDDQGKVLDTKSNDATGNIYFKAIDYTKEGTYEYTIREKAGNDTTIGYDKTEYKATVTVKDIGGKLEATVVYSGTVNFANTYTPAAGSAVLEATKTLTGRDLQAGEFEFELLDDQGKIVDTKSNDASGNIYFKAIDYAKEGTYEYTIREKAGNDSTIGYDKTEYKATVTVKDNNGKLEATVVYSGTVNFANTYTPAAGSAVLEATKTLTGRDLQAGEFEFELLDDKGKVLDTKSNDTSGNIYFKAIDYAKEGTYEYTIREKAGNDTTIGYDKTEYKATITVKDIGGKLEATVSYSGTVNFANTYTPAAGSAVLEATKTLTGRDLQAGEFEFELVDDQGKVLDTKSNDATGNIYFDAISYAKVGTYEYTIREKAGSNSTISYDKVNYTATVTVKDNNGKLEATVAYSGTVNFANTYTPAAGSAVLEATKSLTGRDLQAGEFEFELLDDQGKVVDTKSNDATGNIYFKAIDYAKEGTYEYTIREKVGNDSTIGYDKTEYQATVTVKDIGGKLEATVVYSGTVNFANTYTPAAGSAVLEATKSLTGRDLQAGEFEFELLDDQGKVLDTKSNDVTGNIYFDAIAYDKAGTYEYTIREKAGSNSTISYDKSEYKAVVVVADKAGKLEAVVSYPEPVTFENRYNEPDNGEVTLKKIDNKTGETLAGAEFELQNEAGEVIKGFEKIVTNNKGEVTISNLKAGNYQVVETKAPSGYVIDKTPIPFVITKEDTAKKELVKENKKQTQGIFLKKADSSNQKALANAEFKLQTDSKKIIHENLTTDENGLIYLDELEPGTYQFIETKAPQGYKIDEKPVTFEVVENESKVIELVKENDPLLPNSKGSSNTFSNNPSNSAGSSDKAGLLPRTGSEVRTSLLSIGCAILLVVLLISYKRYNRHKAD
ncbi:Spy0128 family protein [Enterococcus sp. DIV0756]|uniref:Spy0128 family protein n=1 Tax=Enterococcus sp. DIV0756 TaxID=2774636 RepID=UPI003F21ABCA